MTSGFQAVFFEKLGQLPPIFRNIEDTTPTDERDVCIVVFNVARPAPVTDTLNIGFLLLVHDGPSPWNQTAPRFWQNIIPCPSTLKKINAELAKRGHNVRLARGDGYFYFRGGETADWAVNSVSVPSVSSLTLELWIGEFQRLKKLNAKIMRTGKKPGPARS